MEKKIMEPFKVDDVVILPDGKTRTIYRITTDDGILCSDLKWYRVSQLKKLGDINVLYQEGELFLTIHQRKYIRTIDDYPPYRKVCIYQSEEELFELAEKIKEVASQAREERRGKLLEKYVDEWERSKIYPDGLE